MNLLIPKRIRNLGVVFREKLGLNFSLSSSNEVYKKLFFGIEYVCGAEVFGDIAEFGTMSGRTARIMAKGLAKFNNRKETKKLHLFDSFEGLPEATMNIDIESPHVKSGAWRKGTCLGVSPGILKEICLRYLPKERVIIYKGWFKDTLLRIPTNTKFSMVHIDSDLYSSSKEVLEYLFYNKLIQEGTAIFFDDFNCNKASLDFGERRAWREIIKLFSVEYTDCGEYGWAGRKYIVHSYK